jgi:hypothetical protein
LRQLIRPNRDDVIRWYIKLAMVALVLLSDEISSAAVDIANFESGLVKRWINFSIDVIAMLVLVRFGAPREPTIPSMHNSPGDRFRSRVVSVFVVFLIVWSCFVLDVLDPSAIAKVILVVGPLVAVISSVIVVVTRRQDHKFVDH